MCLASLGPNPVRTCLLLLLIACMGGCYIVENPWSTLMFDYMDMRRCLILLKKLASIPETLPKSCSEALCSVEKKWSFLFFLAKAFRVNFWMRHFGHACPKRTSILTNVRCLSKLDRGKLTRGKTPKKLQTSRVYYDKQNRKRYQGGKDLKATQNLSSR